MTSRAHIVHGARYGLGALVLCTWLGAHRAAAEPAPEQVAAEPQSEEVLGSRFTIDTSDPSHGIPNEHQRNARPIEFGNYLMALAGKAEDAEKVGDHLAAAKYYRALSVAVPDEAVSFVKMCREYEAAGKRDEAELACRDALSRHGVTTADFAHYVRLALAQPGSLSSSQVTSLDLALAHLEAEGGTGTIAYELACDVGMRLNDAKRLAGCTAALQQRAPNDLKTIAYEWAFALRRGDLPAAEHAIARARDLGMKADGLAKMEEATAAADPSLLRALLRKPITGALAVFAAIAALGLAGSLALRKRPADRIST